MYLADNYDGAILDIMMPKMDGITVLKNIRAQGNDVPVLILTARSEVDDRVLGLDSGADDYLSKPFAAKELLAANPVQENSWTGKALTSTARMATTARPSALPPSFRRTTRKFWCWS